MSAIIGAKTAMRELAAKAQQVVTDQTLTQAEQKTALDKIEADIKTHADTIQLHEQAQRLVAGGESAPDATAATPDEPQVETRDWSAQVIESPAYANVKNKQTSGASVELKAAATIGEGIEGTFSGGAGLGGQLVTPQFLPGIVPLRFQPLTVADLIASGTTSTSSRDVRH
jgi:hypothetical protein